MGALRTSLGVGILARGAVAARAWRAQSPEMQLRVAEVKESMAVHKQLQAQYSWMEQDIISIKGEQKKEELYNVQLEPDCKPQKTPVDSSSMSDDERKRRGLRGGMIEKKIEEYKEYSDQIKSLVQQYVPPEKEMLAYQQGNVMMGTRGRSAE